MNTSESGSSGSFEMRFNSLFRAGMALAFPCDEQGHVDLDDLPPRARDNYLFARAMVGRDFDVPSVERAEAAFDRSLSLA
ncbi:MAG: hypothetical protein ABI633_08175 [Burkholderiales bacterium]